MILSTDIINLHSDITNIDGAKRCYIQTTPSIDLFLVFASRLSRWQLSTGQ